MMIAQRSFDTMRRCLERFGSAPDGEPSRAEPLPVSGAPVQDDFLAPPSVQHGTTWSFGTARRPTRVAAQALLLLAILLATLGATIMPGAASAAALAQAESADRQSKTVLVHFQEGVIETERLATVAAMGGVMVDWIDSLHVAQVALSAEVDIYAAAASLSGGIPGVTLVEPDVIVRGAFVPNDPYVTDASMVYVPEQLDLFDAWEITRGSYKIVISVIDTGISHEHPEFFGRLLPGYDFVNDDAHADDDHGHGTHVAGIAAAAINNEEGAAGICGNCSILPVKVLNQNNAGSWFSVAKGVSFAVSHGADIIVMSLGAYTGSATMQKAIEEAVANNVLVIAAAGNDKSDRLFYPAAYDGVLAVAATNRYDSSWSLSNFGSYIDLAAPGETVFSSYHDLNNYYGGYTFMSGTSMAAPHVAGLAGLLLSQDPRRTAGEITRLLTQHAEDLGEPGWDPVYGFGRIAPVASLLDGNVPPDGQVGGRVWLDENCDGVRDEMEALGVGGLSIQLYATSTSATVQTSTSSFGFWLFQGLSSDLYTISLQVPDAYVATTAASLSVALAADEHRSALDMGLCRLPAADAVQFQQMVRTQDALTLTLNVLDRGVQAIEIERATISSGPFTALRTVNLSLLGQAQREGQQVTIVDELPVDAQQGPLFYRAVLAPGSIYTAVVEAPPNPASSSVPDEEEQYSVMIPLVGGP